MVLQQPTTQRLTVLIDAQHYSMCGGGLPHDAMHDILGVAPLEVKILLCKYIAGGLLSLEELNDRPIRRIYGYTASQMLLSSHLTIPCRR